MRRFLIFLGILCVLGCVALMALPRAREEPVYQGRKYSAWLADFDSSWSSGLPPAQQEAIRAKAGEAIEAIGTNGIPTLLAMLRAKDNPVVNKLRSQRWIYKLMGPVHFPEFAFMLNKQTSGGFYVLGTNAAGAVPEIIQIYKANISRESKAAAGWALSSVGSSARAALPCLISNLTNTNAQVRFEAGITICDIIRHGRVDPDTVIPAMVKALEDPPLRFNAEVTLGYYGPRAKAAIPALLQIPTNLLDRQELENLETSLKRLGYSKPVEKTAASNASTPSPPPPNQ